MSTMTSAVTSEYSNIVKDVYLNLVDLCNLVFFCIVTGAHCQKVHYAV